MKRSHREEYAELTFEQRKAIREERARRLRIKMLANNLERNFARLDRELEEYYMQREDSTGVLLLVQ